MRKTKLILQERIFSIKLTRMVKKKVQELTKTKIEIMKMKKTILKHYNYLNQKLQNPKNWINFNYLCSKSKNKSN